MNQSFTRRGDARAITPLPFFRETENVSIDPERVRGACDRCGTVLEPIAFSGYYTRRKCDCELIAERQADTARMSAQAARESASAGVARCYTWLPGYDDSALIAKSFDSYDPAAQPNRKAFTEARDQCRDYARQIISSNTRQRVAVGNFLLRGGYGVGKTHLAASICNALRQSLVPCRFCCAPDLFEAIYTAKFEETKPDTHYSARTKQSIIREAARAPLLVLDDLDKLHVRAETDGAYQKKILFEILDGRYKQHLPTLITTNAQGDLVQWLDGASISRLQLVPITMIGIDLRGKGKS